MSDLLEKMRANPAGNWRIADIDAICRKFGVRCIPPRGGGSHFKVSHPSQIDIVVVPFRRPIKSVYVVKFVRYIDAVRHAHAQP